MSELFNNKLIQSVQSLWKSIGRNKSGQTMVCEQDNMVQSAKPFSLDTNNMVEHRYRRVYRNVNRNSGWNNCNSKYSFANINIEGNNNEEIITNNQEEIKMTENSISNTLEKATLVANLLITLVGCLPKLIDAAEKIYSTVAKSGASKKDMVLTIIKSMIPESLEETYSTIENTISNLINIISMFRHGSTGKDPENVK